MLRTELMKGARNCVQGYCAVQPEERVLLWLDETGKVHPDVERALARAIEETGAPLSVLRTKAPIFRYGERLSSEEEEAITGANVLIHALDLENAASVDNADIYRCMWENDLRVTSVIATTPEVMTSDWAYFPPELHYYMWIKSARLLCDTEAHLTDELGTDLHMKLFPWPKGDPLSSSWASVDEHAKVHRPAGTWEFFPGGTIALCPKEVEGTVVFELLEGFAGYLSEPIRVTVKDHWVTKVEGGEEAKWLEERMKRYKNGFYFSEFAWGINPRSPLQQGLRVKAPDTLLFRRAGSYHCAVGLWPGMGVPSLLHWDGGGMKPTLTLGNKTVIDKGHLSMLDDPDVRELASKYGNPDEFLSYES
jgi:2,5-dihydroxypyridine 5,6-dioxygenase